LSTKVKKSDVLYEVLKLIVPGGYDPELDDKEIRGPRGGCCGFEVVGVTVPPWISKVIGRGGIRHGYRYHFIRGGPRRRNKVVVGGRVLPNTAIVKTILRFFEEPGLYENYVLPLYSEGKYKDLVLLFALGGGE